MIPLSLNLEERFLLDCAQANGYVTTDRRDDYDVVSDAYQQWCRAEKVPFVEIALGDATSRVTYSLLEADTRFSPKTERHLRRQLPQHCLSHSEIVVEDDFVIAERVLNEKLPDFFARLKESSPACFLAFL